MTSSSVYTYTADKISNPILEWRTCTVTGEQFPIYKSEKDFLQSISPTWGGQRFEVPLPTMSPQARQQSIMAWRNERKLFKKKSALTDKEVVTYYHHTSPYRVCESNLWRSDQVDNIQYGNDVDNSKTFAEQFNRLLQTAILRPLVASNDNENCAYNNYIARSRNCYMCFSSVNGENCYYTNNLEDSKFCCDCISIISCEFCYNLVYSVDSYQCQYSAYLEQCRYCRGSYRCINCEYCIECSNLVGARYCVRNKQLTKEDFEKYLATYRPSFYQSDAYFPATDVIQSERVSGNLITQSKDVLLSHVITGAENVGHSMRIVYAKDIYDCYGILNTERVYMSVTNSVGGSNKFFGAYCFPNGNHSRYSYDCANCDNVFGCVGLKDKSYCIFNKQYSKEDYENTLVALVSHMQETGERGKFFDPSLCPHAYNNSIAYEYYPADVNQTNQLGYAWDNSDQNIVVSPDIQTIRKKDFSDTDWMKLIDDEQILNKVIICETSSRPFRITKAELELYKKLSLPLPGIHPDIRYKERCAQFKPGLSVFLRPTVDSPDLTLSVFPASDTRKIYSVEGYQKKMFG